MAPKLSAAYIGERCMHHPRAWDRGLPALAPAGKMPALRAFRQPRPGLGWPPRDVLSVCARLPACVFFNIAGCTCIFVCVVAGIGRCCSGGLRPPRRRRDTRSEIDAIALGQIARSRVLRLRLRRRRLVGRFGLRLRLRGFLLQLPQLIPQPRKLAHTRTFLASQQFQILVDLRHQQVARPSRERSLLRGDGFLPRLRRLA